ncbi:DUF3492 domain-containing protein [Streptomyces sp. NPDC060194]|uniref:DUF3492 domain-containing protein n=1 Tax=Streptomyces sp. NPDC060194 TaxID=3347069 RepID=UPI003654309F
MRIGLLTEGGYPYVDGDARLWCDRLVRGLAHHEFDVYALSRNARQEERGWVALPPQVRRVLTAGLWSEPDTLSVPRYGRRDRRRFQDHFADLVHGVCADGAAGEDRFAAGLYGIADLAREQGPATAALRSEAAVRLLESACRTPGAHPALHTAQVADLLESATLVERALRPLSFDWYEEQTLGAVDVCHAASGGGAALPGLLAQRFFGVPLVVTEYGVRLRAHYLRGVEQRPAVRALAGALHGRLAAETYRGAAVVTPGNAHARRWQERCGADRRKLRTVYPGMDPERFAPVVGRADGRGDGGGGPSDTLVWVGRLEPGKDLIGLLHAFVQVRRARPSARLLVAHSRPGEGPETAAYLAHCRSLAERLFAAPEGAAEDAPAPPVRFAEIGSAELPDVVDAYAAGRIAVLSSVVEGFPVSLVEAMFCGLATVATDVGAVVEVVGGTGLVVQPREPRALADACLELFADPVRRERLGAAGRARALEMFTVEQNVAAFRAIYLQLVAHAPVRRGDGTPFADPAEIRVAPGGEWATARTPGGSLSFPEVYS